MISMEDITSVGALSEEEQNRYGNTIRNLKDLAMFGGVFMKTSTYPAEVPQVATRLANFLCWPSVMDFQSLRQAVVARLHVICFGRS